MEVKLNPSEYNIKILNVLRLLAKCAGCDVVNPKWRVNILIYILQFMILIYFFCAIWSIVENFRDDFTVVLIECCLMGSFIQGSAKIFTAIFSAKRVRETTTIIRSIYETYERRSKKYRKVLHENCEKLKNILILISTCYLLCASTIAILPIIWWILIGERYLILTFHIPGVEIDNTVGYIVTLLIQLAYLFFGTFGLFAGDVFVIYFIRHAVLFGEIFKLKIEDLNDHLEIENNRLKPDIKIRLVDIIKWHKLYLKLMENVNETFYYQITVQIITSAASGLITCIVLLFDDWPNAYPFVFIAAYSLYVYCILGTSVEICNDKFCEEIYNISWYYLTVSQQKIVKQMLLKSQSPKPINIAGVLPLTVSTALQITKTIYSILMMSIQFLSDE